MTVDVEKSFGQEGEGQSLDMGGTTLLSPGQFFDDLFFDRILEIVGLQKGDLEAKKLRRFFIGEESIYDFDRMTERMADLPLKLQKLIDIFRTSEDVRRQMTLLPANNNHEANDPLRPLIPQYPPTSLIEIVNISQPIIEQLQALVDKV